MRSRYVANTDQILAFVERAAQIGRQIEERIAEVEREVAALQVDWEGSAADAHRANHETWTREMGDMRSALSELSNAAKGAHDRYVANVEHNVGMWP
ncbi:WXG100 family type VII secretion target [Antrihabitans cavernicola]|uniref:WXG100 family type VII secretion target n=1 Tax=Antrihabitans cavernicola TaxID=2495913 RepID=UPI00165A1019|nr:WXG100 family type VII secretion target [Spelaeibacter cavernicola]